MTATFKHYFSSIREPVKYNPLPFLLLLLTKKCVFFLSQNKVFFVPFVAHVCLFLALLGPFFWHFWSKNHIEHNFFCEFFFDQYFVRKKGGGTPHNNQIRQEVIGGPNGEVFLFWNVFVSVSLELAPHFQIFCDG